MDKHNPEKKVVAERLMKLPISLLRQNGFLEPGVHETVIGLSDGTQQMRMTTNIGGPEGDFVSFNFVSTSCVIYDLSIQIVSTPCEVSDKRNWFKCPKCDPDRRATVLYFDKGYFRCGQCLGLTYTSKLKPLEGVSTDCLAVFDKRHLFYDGKLTRRAKRLVRQQKKARAVQAINVKQVVRMQERLNRRFKNLKKLSERELKKIEQRTSDGKKEQ